MRKQLSLSAYRAIDLGLWVVLLIVFEGVIIRASASRLFMDQAFTVSLAAGISCIVYMRWGYPGALHAALAGLVYSLLMGGKVSQTVIYTAGNLLSLAVVPLMNRYGKEKLRQTRYLYLGISMLTLLLMQTGRAMVSLVFGAGMADVIRFYTTDSLSMVFTPLMIWIVHRLDGVYEDQKHYLRRFHEEQKKERNEFP